MYIYITVSQEGNKFCVLHELDNKTQHALLMHCECTVRPSMGSVGDKGAKPMKNS